MTREEAIQILADLTDNPFLHTWEEQYKALHMAIEALSADVVSREDYHNLLTATNDIDRALREYQAKEEQLSIEVVHKPDYSYEADMVRRLKEAQSADAVSREDTVTLNSPITIQAEMVPVVRCKDCKYQNECEEMVLFDINDDEVMGHRVHWCSYGRRE